MVGCVNDWDELLWDELMATSFKTRFQAFFEKIRKGSMFRFSY